MAFTRGFGWDENEDGEATGAKAYLACNYRIRLTDSRKDPLPFAKCRIEGAPDKVFTCDEHGIVEIPIEDRGLESLMLEWESAQADPSGTFPWKNRFDVSIRSAEDEACRKRLTHLGYPGDTLPDQVTAYQTHFGMEPTGKIDDIREELMDWHEGGTYPDMPDAPEGDDFVPGEAAPGPADYSIRLTDSNGKPIANASWFGKDSTGTDRNGGADGEGRAELQSAGEWIDLTWEDPAKPGVKYRNTVRLRIAAGDSGVPQMLANLGYPGATRAEQIADFRSAFGYSKDVTDEMVLMDLAAWHNGGEMPQDESAGAQAGKPGPKGKA
jgi:hypothetical protein